MTEPAAVHPDLRSAASWVAPALAIAVAGWAVRTPLAARHAALALMFLMWIAADSLVLSAMARAPGRRPGRRAVTGALAGASFVVMLGAPVALRQALATMPVVIVAMAAVLLVHLASSARRAARIARSGRGWVEAVSVIVPAPVVRLAAAEGRLLHMALFRWGGPPDAPAGARAFAYHRHLAPTCTALLVLQVIEIGVYHIFVGHWNRTAAIVLFVVSDLGLVYLVGLIKSFRFRPVLLTADGVRVRAGILIDTLIPFDQIAGIEPVVTGPIVHDPATCNAALLAWPNVVLNLTRPLPRGSWRRRRPLAWRIAFRLDEPEPFLRLLAWRIGQGGPLA